MTDRMTNDRGHDFADKPDEIVLPDPAVDPDEGDEPAWSPDNDLPKTEPSIGDVPANEGGEG